jgi:hypothetical protein
MVPIAIFFMLAIGAPAGTSQARPATSPAVEEHIRQTIKELPPNSLLRRALLQGARGDGIHYPWMDLMHREGVKRAIVWVGIRFDHRGRPKQIRLSKVQYFTEYAGEGSEVTDPARLTQLPRSAE